MSLFQLQEKHEFIYPRLDEEMISLAFIKRNEELAGINANHAVVFS
jgi:hypothetical protein